MPSRTLSCLALGLAAAQLTLTGCRGVEVRHRAIDLSVGTDSQVALVDAWSLASVDPSQGPAVTLVDLTAGTVERQPIPIDEGDALRCVAFSPDRALLAVGTEAGRVRVYEGRDEVLSLQVAEPGLELTRLAEGATSIRLRVRVVDMAWIGDSALAVSYLAHPECGESRECGEGCGPRAVVLSLNGKAPQVFRLAPAAQAPPIAHSASQGLLLSLDDDSILRAYRLDSSELAWTKACEWGAPTLSGVSIAVAPSDAVVAVSGSGQGGGVVVCYELATQALRWKRPTRGECSALAFVRGGALLAALCERADGTRLRAQLLFLAADTGEVIESIDLPGDPCALDITPEGDGVVVAHSYTVEAIPAPPLK